MAKRHHQSPYETVLASMTKSLTGYAKGTLKAQPKKKKQVKRRAR